MKKYLYLTTLVAGLLPIKAIAAPSTAPTIPLPPGPTVEQIIGGIVNVLIWVAGIASVIVIIVSGIMYITSGGNEKSVTNAKNALLYAIIGLVISIAAFAIVNFVLKSLG
jgi:hypothetical protein